MSTIDLAAIIEQAVRASWEDDIKDLGLDSWDELDPEDREAISAHTRIALPVIAKALLAPLRELHPPVPATFRPWGEEVRDVTLCRCVTGITHDCPTQRLLDAIEAEVHA